MRFRVREWLETEHAFYDVTNGTIIIVILVFFLIIDAIFAFDPIQAWAHGSPFTGSYVVNSHGQSLVVPISFTIYVCALVSILIGLMLAAVFWAKQSK